MLVVAIGRGAEVIRNPEPETPFLAGDHLAVIGTPAQVSKAETLLGDREPD